MKSHFKTVVFFFEQVKLVLTNWHRDLMLWRGGRHSKVPSQHRHPNSSF